LLVSRERAQGGEDVALNEALFKRLIETPGVPGREDQQREIAREELNALTDEVRTDAMGSVIGTKRAREDARVMVAAHMTRSGSSSGTSTTRGSSGSSLWADTTRRTWSPSASS
jgi:hypothetical protein